MREENRSLKFEGDLNSKLYDANIKVTGAVTGWQFGTLMVTRSDLVELGRLSAHLILKIDERRVREE